MRNVEWRAHRAACAVLSGGEALAEYASIASVLGSFREVIATRSKETAGGTAWYVHCARATG